VKYLRENRPVDEETILKTHRRLEKMTAWISPARKRRMKEAMEQASR